jgi:hypothetical protein
MPRIDIPYEQLPDVVKDNLSPEQWLEAQRDLILEGEEVPDTAYYVNLKNSMFREYLAGERAEAPLLPVHDLSGGRGKDSTQFHTTPPGAPGVP